MVHPFTTQKGAHDKTNKLYEKFTLRYWGVLMSAMVVAERWVAGVGHSSWRAASCPKQQLGSPTSSFQFVVMLIKRGTDTAEGSACKPCLTGSSPAFSSNGPSSCLMQVISYWRHFQNYVVLPTPIMRITIHTQFWNKFTTFYGVWIWIIVQAYHWATFWASLIQSIPSHPNNLWCIYYYYYCKKCVICSCKYYDR